MQLCKALTPEILFGYSENDRLQKLSDVETVLKKELDAIKKKSTTVHEAAKRARGAEDKAKINAMLSNLLAEGEQIQKTMDENRALASNKL